MTDDPRTDNPEAVAPAMDPATNDIDAIDDRFIDLVAADAESSPDEAAAVMERRAAMGASFYSSLLAALVGLQRKESEAETLWHELLAHKFTMSRQVGRNVGIRVAALDYFINITGDIDSSTRVVDRRTLVDTAQLAVTDGLTNLYNHRYFHDRLQNEIEQAARDGSPLSVVMFDIDHFKDYNDVNGHVAGDVALHEVAGVVKRVVGEAGGVAARYGGEEFAAIFPACGKGRAGEVAEAIRAEIEAHPFPNEFVLQSRRLTLSGGVGEFPLDATDRRGLVDYADRALYESKSGGRNRITIFAPNRRRETRRPLAAPMTVLVGETDGTATAIDVETVDLSASGVLCRVDRELLEGAAVRLRLPEPWFSRYGEQVAVLVRIQPVSHDAWHAAFRFVRPPESLVRAMRRYVAENKTDPDDDAPAPGGEGDPE